MLKVWGRANSLNVQKVLWCCTELSLTVERIDWAGEFGGNDAPHYRALHPHGKVPTLEDGATVVWESNTIQRYLCRTRGGDALLPADPVGASLVERWMDWQLAGLNPPMIALLLGYYRSPEAERNLAALEGARKQAVAAWAVLDGILGTQDFVAGPSFTLADIGIGIQAYRWYAYPVTRPKLPHLERWLDRIKDRTGFTDHVEGPVT